jgi:DNA-directed RNA polymerase specialized sigma24 family protein
MNQLSLEQLAAIHYDGMTFYNIRISAEKTIIEKTRDLSDDFVFTTYFRSEDEPLISMATMLFFHRFFRILVNKLQSFSNRNRADIEDSTQNFFMKLYDRAIHLNPIGSQGLMNVDAYFFVCVKYALFDIIKTKSPGDMTKDSPLDEWEPDQFLNDMDDSTERLALIQLEEDIREAVLFHLVEDGFDPDQWPIKGMEPFNPRTLNSSPINREESLIFYHFSILGFRAREVVKQLENLELDEKQVYALNRLAVKKLSIHFEKKIKEVLKEKK